MQVSSLQSSCLRGFIARNNQEVDSREEGRGLCFLDLAGPHPSDQHNRSQIPGECQTYYGREVVD